MRTCAANSHNKTHLRFVCINTHGKTARKHAKGVHTDQPGCTTPLSSLTYLRKTLPQNLEEFVNLKALWLQSNALTRIEGLGHLTGLRVLHLHSNRISSLEGLEGLVNLETLNLR